MRSIAKVSVLNAGPRTAYAAGGTYDDCAVANWYYTLRLKNNAGSTLQEDQATGHYGQNLVVGATVGCAGAIVHSFFYINAAGSGTSDTSGTNSNCAY